MNTYGQNSSISSSSVRSEADGWGGAAACAGGSAGGGTATVGTDADASTLGNVLPSGAPRIFEGDSVRPLKKVNMGEKMSRSPRLSGPAALLSGLAGMLGVCFGGRGLCVMNSLEAAGVPGSARRSLGAPSAEGDQSIFESELKIELVDDPERCESGGCGVEPPAPCGVP